MRDQEGEPLVSGIKKEALIMVDSTIKLTFFSCRRELRFPTLKAFIVDFKINHH